MAIKVVPRSLVSSYNRLENDFSPRLVGLQFSDGDSLFTLGNFAVTTNLNGRLVKNFELGGQWSEYYSLDNLKITENVSEIIQTNDLNVKLNFDKKNINRYAYFGSFYELVRSSIEQIIQKWKGSLYITNVSNFSNSLINNVFSFKYNSGDNTATFTSPLSAIKNNFLLEIEQKSVYDTNVPSGEIYNVVQNYSKYNVFLNGNEYPVIGFTGITEDYQYITVTTKGNPFPTLTGSTFGSFNYHIKPKNEEVEMFFKQLTDFEEILLNRLTKPIYTSSFNVPIPNDNGFTLSKINVTWPVTDGYNIDINTPQYTKYVENILNLATNYDTIQTDLVSRRFVSESIHEYDTVSDTNDDSGMKISKMLRIYGREYDEVKKYIDGISFANVVTYNKLDNTSDNLIKVMAKNLGFDVILTTINNNFNLIGQNEVTTNTPFSGYSRSLSAVELDTELWRRLVINAWWLYKSKGTRKVLEFFLNLFKIPSCSVSLNEYVYLAENKLNLSEVYEQLTNIFDSDVDLTTYPLDNEGFPKMVNQTISLNIFNQNDLFADSGIEENYFQKNGFWYNGGNEITDGNNPHIGPYDYGKSYIDSYRYFVKGVGTTGLTNVTTVKNYFNNYNEGTFGFTVVPYYGQIYANFLNNNNYVENAFVDSAGITYIGGNQAATTAVPNGDIFSLKIKFKTGSEEACNACNAPTYNNTNNGLVYLSSTNSPLNVEDCCSFYWTSSLNDPTLKCYWCPTPTSVCSAGQYLALYNNQEIQQIAISLGWTTNSTSTPSVYITNIMTPFFSQYGCILLSPDKRIISDKSCCEDVNSGDLVTMNNGSKICVKNNVNCNNGYIKSGNHVYVINI